MSNLAPKNNTQGEKVVLAYSGGLDAMAEGDLRL